MTGQFVIKFDYNLENIHKAVAEVEKMDLADLDQVKEQHKFFVKIRTTIKKQEKAMVDEANAYRKEVFAKRNEYLDVSVPVEERLKAVIDAEDERKLVEARKELLPEKKEKLGKLKLENMPTDDEILAMDEKEWVEFYGNALAEHDAEIERVAREDQIRKEAEEKARIDAEAKIEAAKREAEDLKQKEEQAKKDAEEAEKREAKKLAKQKKYQAFLKEHGCTQATKDAFHIKDDRTKVVLYKKVGEYTK